MASQLNITFDYNEGALPTYGRIEVVHINAQGRRTTYTLFPFTISQTGPAATFAVSSTDDAFTAQQFAFVFNTKFRSAINGNFDQMYELNGNVVSLIATQGEFLPASYLDGDALNIISSVTNLDDPPNNRFDWGQDVLERGDCLTTKWSFRFAQGGDPPYNIIDNATENILLQNWSGFTTETLDFDRNKLHSGRVEDSNGVEIGRYSFRSPNNIRSSDFSITSTTFINSADLIITQNVFWENTGADLDANGNPTPGKRINYAVAQVVPGQGIDINSLEWKESNIFSGLVPGSYKVYIRDKYDCIVSKQYFIDEFDPTQNIQEDEEQIYFTITEFNSLSFKNETAFDSSRRGRKNYKRTLAYEEHVRIPYPNLFYFEEGFLIQTQFKSSYPFHIITLYKCDGTKEAIPYTRIQSNISVSERVSAKLFRYFDGQEVRIGVYFDGGNLYDPDTGNTIGNSPYFQTLPNWAEVGRVVEIETLSGQTFGARQVIQTNLYDEERNTLFMVVDGTLGSTDDVLDAVVTARYNRHPYDVYRFDIEQFQGQGMVVIEAGYDQDNIDQNQIWCSEVFRGIDFDTTDWLRIEWFLNRSVGEAVAYESFQGIMWLAGRMLPIPVSEAETLVADDRTRSLDQDQRMALKMDIKALTPRQWHKLGLAAAIGNRGELIIQGESVVRTEGMTEERIGLTNKSNIEMTFEPAGETPRTRPIETVLDVGSGTGSDPDEVTNWKGWIRIITSDYQVGGEITYIKVDHQNQEKFVVAGRAD